MRFLSSRTAVAGALLLCATVLGAQTQRLSQKPEFWNPEWSPDGRSIVFESNVDGKYSIYTVHADGTGLTRLTPDTATSEQPRWSPDGRTISFSSDRGGDHSDIYIMQRDGRDVRRLTVTPSGGFYQSSISPDGKLVVFQGRFDNRETRDRVFVVSIDGSGMRQVTDSSYGAEGPEWSADGRWILFTQVPYEVRYWSEMNPARRDAARRNARQVRIRPDGSGLQLFARPKARVPDIDGASGVRRSPDGRQVVYQRAVDGWSGIHVASIDGRHERLIAGGAGAGPLGYLRTTAPIPYTDTLDVFESSRTGSGLTRSNGAWVLRELRRVGGQRWELTDSWRDSTGRETARQSVRTAAGSLATQVEWVRARTDSASLLAIADRVTGWVVAAGQGPRLFDGASTGERYASTIASGAAVRARPSVGQVFVYPIGALYGADPLATRVDSMRVTRSDTLRRRDGTLVPVLTLARGVQQAWVDPATGRILVSRGRAGPERFWWHIVRGVEPPLVP